MILENILRFILIILIAVQVIKYILKIVRWMSGQTRSKPRPRSFVSDRPTKYFNIAFFPSHWPPEKVERAVYEAYDDFIAKGEVVPPMCDGKYVISGFTKENVEVEMIITKEKFIKMAYPIIE